MSKIGRAFRIGNIARNGGFGLLGMVAEHDLSNKPNPTNYLKYDSVQPQYNRLKAGLTQTARGVTNESVLASGSNLAARGLEGVPGVQADVAGRANRTMLGSLLPQHAAVDQQAIQADEQKRQHQERLQFAEKMAREAKTEAKKQFWAQMAIDIAALTVTVATGGAAAPIALPAAAAANKAVARPQMQMNPRDQYGDYGG